MAELCANFVTGESSVRAELTGELVFGMPGESGGYYTISITQPNDSTMRLTFAPSQNTMPAIPPVDIALLRGQDGYTPLRGTDYWTEEDRAEIQSYVETAILGGAW